MKIWLQSATSMGVDPLWKGYEEALKKHARHLARSDSRLTFSGVKIMTPAIERHAYFRLLLTPQIVENALVAEKEGFSVFAVNNMCDLGLAEVREVIRIPSVFCGETSLLFACLLGRRFSLISHNWILADVMERTIVQRYGLEKRAAPPQAFNMTLAELASSFQDPAKFAEEFTQAARRAIGSGAEILVPSSNVLNMLCVSAGLREVEGVMVLDVLAPVIKTAEMMVELREKTGLSVSRKYQYLPPEKELLATVRRAYHLE